MGSRRLRGVVFQSYSGDHEGAQVPHVHAHFNEGDVAIEILEADRAVRLSSQHGRHPVDPGVRKTQVKRALRVAAEEVDALLELWRASRS